MNNYSGIALEFRFQICFHQVALTNQVVTEGQEVTMSVRIHGQPKPMIYW